MLRTLQDRDRTTIVTAITLPHPKTRSRFARLRSRSPQIMLNLNVHLTVHLLDG